MKWKPIISDPDKELYLKNIDKIASTLDRIKKDLHPKDLGLISGKTGIMLFLVYYATFSQNQAYYDSAIDLLNEIMDGLNDNFLIHTFGIGHAGFAWTIGHLAKNNLIDDSPDELVGGIEPLLYKTMKLDLLNRHYDYLHGAIGNGLYFLECAEKPQFRAYISELIDELDRISIKTSDGEIKWLSLIDFEKKQQGFNMGMSHGIPGIIAYLSRVMEAGISTEKASMLLNGAIKYLLNQRLDRGKEKKYISIFPSSAIESAPPRSSRLAWCYGDPGIGAALWLARNFSKVKDLGCITLEILSHGAVRRDLQENVVLDACLCHGTSGLAHIFNRIYQDTGENTFKDASLFWYDQTLKKAECDERFFLDPGFLEGIAGIGLALISAISDMEPKWDRALLLS